MRKLQLFAAGIILLMFSCQKTEDSEISVLQNSSGANGIPLSEYPFQQLVGVDVTHGMYYLAHEDQVFVIENGDLTCAAIPPGGNYQPLSISPQAVKGLYALPMGGILHFELGKLSRIGHIFRECITRTVVEFRDCPPGQLGAIKYEITDCYFGRFKISSDTVVVGDAPCEPIFMPDFGPLYFEGPLGEVYANPICF